MEISLLMLHPYGRQPFSVRVSESDGRRDFIRQRITKTEEAVVFSDLSYEFSLLCEETTCVHNIAVYINDVCVPSIYQNGRILFPNRSTSDRRIFMDCYGFVEITLVVCDAEGIEYQYSTDYMPVLVQRGEMNAAVKAMVEFVSSNQESLLFQGEARAKNTANLKECGYQDFSAKIMLAEEIASIYESSYAYFKANRRFKIDRVSKIDRFEHLSYITPATIQFIATHPEELHPVRGKVGIRIGNRFYQPEKTLLLQNECSYDIYENRVVLGFIWKMIKSLDEMYEQGVVLLKQIPSDEEYDSEYMYSSFFMFIATRKMLENGLVRLKNLRIKFAHLKSMYDCALRIEPMIILNEPHPSPIFMSVPQYRRIFDQILRWFRFGLYDFAKESFMLSFIKISSLYEGYLLAKMIVYFQSRGYVLENSKQCVYPTKRKWKYKNTNCNNTFVFKNERHKLTLYYQPVIYDTDETGVNGIGLMRNNSISLLEREDNWRPKGGHYYSPDYLIKVEDNSSARYLILDAKFSDYVQVRCHCVKDLAFKYLFSISPIRPTDSIVGLGLIYGKCTASEQMKSAYDKCLPGQQIHPLVELLPLMEGIANEGHFSKLDALMRKMME